MCQRVYIANVSDGPVHEHNAMLYGASLARILQANKTLESVCLGCMDLSAASYGKILRSLKNNQSVTCLVLWDACKSVMDSVDVESWRDLLETNSTLQDLEFQYGLNKCPGIAGVCIIFQALAKNTALKRLTLEDNNATKWKDRLAARRYSQEDLSNAISTALSTQGCNVVHLKLNGILMEDKYLVGVAESLQHNTKLQELQLVRVGLGDQFMCAISSSLGHNTTLQFLDVGRNTHITNIGIHEFSKPPQHNAWIETTGIW